MASLRGPLVGLLMACMAAAAAVALRRPPLPGQLAYVSGGRITILDGGARLAVGGSGCAADPSWSADGRWLAFVTYPCTAAPPSGRLAVAAAGGGIRRVIQEWPGAVAPGAFAWSPVADVLAVAPATGGLYVATPSGAAHLVAGAGLQAGAPRWSPDGQEIAFVRTLPFQDPLSRSDALYTAGVRGGHPTLHFVAPKSVGIILAGWWPDGKGLLFWGDPLHSASLAADGLGLESLALTGGSPQTLATTLVDAGWIAWAPDGRLLTVAGAGRLPSGQKQLVVCQPGAATCRPLPNPPGAVALDPAWSPDGSQIAFVAPTGRVGARPAPFQAWLNSGTLWIERADGTGAHPIPGAGTGVRALAWSRDGTGVLYARDGALWLIPARGGPARRIADLGAGPAGFAWHA